MHEAVAPQRPFLVEQVYLDCGRYGAQLMHDSLGSGAVPRNSLLGLALLWVACTTTTIRAALLNLPATPAEPSRTDADTLLQLALRRTVEERAVPDYGLLPDSQAVVVLRRNDSITPRILPQSSRVRFLLLTLDQIRDLADRYDHFVYVTVSLGKIEGDSAIVGAGTTWAPSKKRPGTVYMSGGSCAWQYRKREDGWHFERTLGCLII